MSVPPRGPVPDDAPVPDDLPSDAAPPRGVPVGPPSPTWVPQRSTPSAPEPSVPPVTTGTGTSADAGGFVTPPGATPGARVRPWQLALAAALVVVPLLVWLGVSLTRPAAEAIDDPVARRALPAPVDTQATPSTTRPPTGTPAPTASDRTTVTARPVLPSRTATRVPTSPGAPGATTRVRPSVGGALTGRPSLLPAPSVPVTAITPGAKVIRFEARAAGGQPFEVSLSDAARQRFEYPAQTKPLAIELPVPGRATSSDYYSLRVRVPYDSAGTRGDVTCRVLVDGVVVMSQQGQGYVTCYLSPYYDVRRT